MMLGGKLLSAPIGDNPQRVLDIGTGTGKFIANDMLTSY
jgi:ubiquinone/menaquinone biosynthesis C-methylase UbiE